MKGKTNMMAAKKQGFNLGKFILNNIIYIISIGFIIVLSISSNKFLTADNILNILISASPVLIVSIGMAFTIITRGIDMSVGSVVFLTADIGAVLAKMGVNTGIAIGVMFLAAILIGAVNGLVAAYFRIYPLLSTMAMMYIARGIGMMLTDGNLIILPKDKGWEFFGTGEIIGISMPVIIALIVLLIAHIVLTRTSFGRHLYAIGGNEKTAHEKGIDIFKIKMIAYIISGFMAGLTGLIYLSKLMSVSQGMGSGLEFTAIIACVLGGISLFGGTGSLIPGAVIGTLIITIISNGLVLLGASPYLYDIVNAVVILIVVIVDTIKNNQIAMRKVL